LRILPYPQTILPRQTRDIIDLSVSLELLSDDGSLLFIQGRSASRLDRSNHW
jgi:hypothetical protein